MCEKAEEIQNSKFSKDAEYWIIDAGDMFSTPSFGIVVYGSKTEEAYQIERESVWLPRQDQLIEMVGDGNGIFGGYADFIDQFEKYVAKTIDRIWQKDRFRYTSFEQLFMMFVMSVKYDKIWEKRTWTKANAQST